MGIRGARFLGTQVHQILVVVEERGVGGQGPRLVGGMGS